MTLDTTQFHKYEESINKTRTRQKTDLSQQLRESLEEYRSKVSRRNFVAKRLADIEHSLEVKNQQIESLHTAFTTALFKEDEKAMEEAKASRVEVAAEIEDLENEHIELKQEQEDSSFDTVSEGGQLLQDVRKAKGLVSGDPRARCLDEDVERAFVQVDADTRDAKMQRVRSNRNSVASV